MSLKALVHSIYLFLDDLMENIAIDEIDVLSGFFPLRSI